MSELTGWIRASACSADDVAFHKATACTGTATCVEVATCDCQGGTVHVRDSKDEDGPTVPFDATAWAEFLAGVRAGEFDNEESA
jgi:Domain of unknown function (DUF397)